MTIKQFDEYFMKCKQACSPQSEEDVIKAVERYTDENGNISLDRAVSAIHIESVRYTNNLVYNILLPFCEKD